MNRVLLLAFPTWQEWLILLIPIGLWTAWSFRNAAKREWFYLLCVVAAIITALWLPQHLIEQEIKAFRASVPPASR